MRVTIANETTRPTWFEVEGKRYILDPGQSKEVPEKYQRTLVVERHVTVTRAVDVVTIGPPV